MANNLLNDWKSLKDSRKRRLANQYFQKKVSDLTESDIIIIMNNLIRKNAGN